MFKVGDRVRVVNYDDSENVEGALNGRAGVVVGFYSLYIAVDLDDKPDYVEGLFSFRELELE